MASLSSAAGASATRPGTPDDDSAFDETQWERRAHSRAPSARWIGWRLRALVLAALVGCLAMFLLMRALTSMPALDAELGVSDDGVLTLQLPAAPLPTQPRAIVALIGPDERPVPLDPVLLQRSPRWLALDADRERLRTQHDALAQALARGSVRFVGADGSVNDVSATARGAAGLGWVFWLLATLALLLYLVAMVVLLARPEPRNALYALMSFAQVGNLLWLAAVSPPTLGWPADFMRWELGTRTAFDLITAAALAHVTMIHPRRVSHGGWRAGAVWGVTLLFILLELQETVPHAWWWTQALQIGGFALTISQLSWMQRHEPHPLALQLVRFCAVALGTLVVLTTIVSALGPALDSRSQAATIGSSVWVVFLAAMLLLLPFLSRTQQLMREFSLLAGVSTVATALDLLFVAVFSLGNFASLTLALFLSLAAYAGARQWLVSQMLARQRLTTERMFEHLYRMARDVQRSQRDAGEPLARLMRELFEPLDVHLIERHTRRARVVGEGSSLVVPVPALGVGANPQPSAVVLGFADRGRRLFTEDDARLANRIVDLLARAVAYDQAVERGRSEERVRIAQDLHDDIGARLLTLMYKASSPEMEDYLRHTLKDLKTLTRGLAAPSHPLSWAVAEWKADIAQRLAAADCHLRWSFSYQQDFELGVVQWSALTRVLRELVSNALVHAHASTVEIDATLDGGALNLSVADDGVGRRPEAWSHGLGLGGVRKRVKQLGGSVEWRENAARGIVCRVRVPRLGPK
jgi:signal transduction histidine kinase